MKQTLTRRHTEFCVLCIMLEDIKYLGICHVCQYLLFCKPLAETLKIKIRHVFPRVGYVLLASQAKKVSVKYGFDIQTWHQSGGSVLYRL